MTKKIFIICTVVLALFPISCIFDKDDNGDTTSYNLRVAVTDSSGAGLSGAKVFIAGKDTSVLTNDSGVAAFVFSQDLASGQTDEVEISLDSFFYTESAIGTYDTSLELSLIQIRCPRAATSSDLTLISPNGGEIFYTGDTIFVLGESSDINFNGTIELLCENPVSITDLEPLSDRGDTLAFIIADETLATSHEYRISMKKYNFSSEPVNCCETSECFFAIRHN